jgi:uncharacterized protein YjiS (DUF1127 family)
LIPTFIVDPAHEHQIALRGDGDMPESLSVGEPPPVMGNAAPAASLPRRLWRIASALYSHLLGRRHRLPPEDDHLRHDIGLSERDIQREYWQYYWWDH